MREQSILLQRWILLLSIFTEAVYILLEVVPFYEYDSENKKTDQVGGFTYTVINSENFERIAVKVQGTQPLISQKELTERREQGEKFFVEFDNAEVKCYYSKFKSTYVDTFRADAISFVEND